MNRIDRLVLFSGVGYSRSMNTDAYDAVIFTGGSTPPDEVVIRLCRHSPYIVCADSGWDTAFRCGVHPSCLVGDFDSATVPLPSDNRISRYPRAKDASDTDLAFEAALNAGCRSIAVVGGGGGRMDHWLALWHLFCRQPQWRLWETADETVYRVASGEIWHADTEKKRRVVSVYAIGEKAEAVTNGFRWPLDGYPLSAAAFSLSNETDADGASLKVTAGEVAVIVPRYGAFPTSD